MDEIYSTVLVYKLKVLLSITPRSIILQCQLSYTSMIYYCRVYLMPFITTDDFMCQV